jgi:hypothetical protein
MSRVAMSPNDERRLRDYLAALQSVRQEDDVADDAVQFIRRDEFRRYLIALQEGIHATGLWLDPDTPAYEEVRDVRFAALLALAVLDPAEARRIVGPKMYTGLSDGLTRIAKTLGYSHLRRVP